MPDAEGAEDEERVRRVGRVEVSMTFAEIEKMVIDKVGVQYVCFSWERDHYSDCQATTVCRIYVSSVRQHFVGLTWVEAYGKFDKVFGNGSIADQCPSEEVAA